MKCNEKRHLEAYLELWLTFSSSFRQSATCFAMFETMRLENVCPVFFLSVCGANLSFVLLKVVSGAVSAAQMAEKSTMNDSSEEPNKTCLFD